MRDTLSRLGYTFYTANNEFHDNGIDANASVVKTYLVKDGKSFNSIIVADNGKGMSLETLPNALNLGESTGKNANDNVGLYGTGMKSAALSYGQCLEVFTKCKETETVYYGVLDVSEGGNNETPVFYYGEADEEQVKFFNTFGFENGTVVKVSKLYNISNKDFYSCSNAVIKNIGRKYYYLIKDAGIEFYVNDKKVEPISAIGLDVIPGIIKLSETGAYFEYEGNIFKYNAWFIPRTEENQEITRQPRNAGLYIYRQYILTGEALSFGLLGKNNKDNWYSGLRIEIFTDGNSDKLFNTTCNKAINDNDIDQGFHDKLLEVFGPYTQEAKRLEKQYSKKDGISEDVKKSLDIATKKIQSNKLVNPDVEKKKREKNPNPKKQLHPNPHKKPRVSASWFGGFEFASLGETDRIYEIRFGEGGQVFVFINTDHIFYKEFLLNCDTQAVEVFAMYFAAQYEGLKSCGYYLNEDIAKAIDELMLQTSEAFRKLYK